MNHWKRRALAAEAELGFYKNNVALAHLGEPLASDMTRIRLMEYNAQFDSRQPFVALVGNSGEEAVLVGWGDGVTLYNCVRGWGGFGPGKGDEARAHPNGEWIQRAKDPRD